jgi:DMSO/TMAO reductase YedYZ heme-binding membrane subunit
MRIEIITKWLKVFTETSENQLRVIGAILIVILYYLFITSDIQSKDGMIFTIVTNTLLTLVLVKRKRK